MSLQQPKVGLPKSIVSTEPELERTSPREQARGLGFEEGEALFRPPENEQRQVEPRGIVRPEVVPEVKPKAKPEDKKREKTLSQQRRESERKSKAGELGAGIEGGEVAVQKAIDSGLSVSEIGKNRQPMVRFLVANSVDMAVTVWALKQTGLDLAKAPVAIDIALTKGAPGKALVEANKEHAVRLQLQAWKALITPSLSDARFKALYANKDAVWLAPLLDGAHEAGLNHVLDLLVAGKAEEAQGWTTKAKALDYEPTLVAFVGAQAGEHVTTSIANEKKALESERDVKKEEAAKEAGKDISSKRPRERAENKARQTVVSEYGKKIDKLEEGRAKRTEETEGELSKLLAVHKGPGAQKAVELAGGDPKKALALMPLMSPGDNAVTRLALGKLAIASGDLDGAVKTAVLVMGKFGGDAVRAPAVFEYLENNDGAEAHLEWIAGHLARRPIEDLKTDLGYLDRFPAVALTNLAYALDNAVPKEVINALGDNLWDATLGRWALVEAKAGTMTAPVATQLGHYVTSFGTQKAKGLFTEAWKDISGDKVELVKALRLANTVNKVEAAVRVAKANEPTVEYLRELMSLLSTFAPDNLDGALADNDLLAARVLLEARLNEGTATITCTNDNHYVGGDSHKGGAQRTGIFKSDVKLKNQWIHVHNHYRENSVQKMTSLHLYLGGVKGPELTSGSEIGKACATAHQSYTGRTRFTV
ncbi:MAG TPA: hypothetical protein PK095_10375 [Myxococcota bacterium]|nr:hypothetical protein [Myxococcota bacterium]